MPVSFVANQGRWDARASWVASGAEATAYFLEGGVRWALQGWALDQVLVGARPAAPVASVSAPGVVSYFVGEAHHAGLPTATELMLRDAWPGVDVVWSGTGGHIEATYRLAPGADPSQVRIAWQGAESVAVTGEGRLAVTTPVRSFEEDAPKAFQEVDGRRVPVDVAYDLDAGAGTYGFRLGAYDPGRPLVIDPVVLVYAGFLGGATYDSPEGIAVDGAGNAYVTGTTDSTAATFPEVGAFQAANGGGTFDAFVAKVSADGSTLLYASFLGGSGTDQGVDIAVDGAGNAYVTGDTASTAATFPFTVGVFQAANAGGQDAFVAKVSANGATLVYAGFLGGSSFDSARGIAVNGAGNAHVTGLTSSATFPVTGGAFQPANAGGAGDAFVAKVSADGSTLAYASFLGGNGNDQGTDIAVDGSGNAYVTGLTASTAATFPETAGAFQLANAGGADDAFVAKVSADGTTLAYASFLGGAGDDIGAGIAVNSAGQAYVFGQTDSTAATFPETPSVFQPENAGGVRDAFVAKVSADGSSLAYASFLGGSGIDQGFGIAVDGAGNAYVTGRTDSLAATFPETAGVFQPANGGGVADAFVAKVVADGSALAYASFLGGNGNDWGFDVAVDGLGNAYVTGRTTSTAATFPETAGVFQPANAGGVQEGFLAKVAVLPDPTLSINDVTLAEGDSGTKAFIFTITRTGSTAAASSVQWSTADGSAIAPGDYTAVAPTTVNFVPGDAAETVSVTVNGDTAFEANDGFTVNLSSPVGATINDGTGVGRMNNDDPSVVSVNDVTVTEGDSGTTTATFTITRTGDTGGSASVKWSTANGTASGSTDFTGVGPTTVNFFAGVTVRTVSVIINGDTAVEANETFQVRLTQAVGVTIGDGSGLGRITNNDAATFSVNDVTMTEGNAGTKAFSFTVTRSGAVGGAATVQWSTANGTATAAGGDYVAVGPTTLTFFSGQTVKTAAVTVKGDSVVEANETFQVRLTSPVGATMLDGSGLGRITNDD